MFFLGSSGFRNREVREYLFSAREVFEKYNDIYKDVKLKDGFSKIRQTEDMCLVWSDMHTGMINKHPLTKKVTYNEAIQE